MLFKVKNQEKVEVIKEEDQKLENLKDKAAIKYNF